MIVTKWVVVAKVVQCDFNVDPTDSYEILTSDAINPPEDMKEGHVQGIYGSKMDAETVAQSLSE